MSDSDIECVSVAPFSDDASAAGRRHALAVQVARRAVRLWIRRPRKKKNASAPIARRMTMTMAAITPPERPGRFLASPLRTEFASAGGDIATIAGMTVVPKWGPWKLSPVFCGVVVPGVNMLVVVAGGNDDDEVSDGFITGGCVGVRRELEDDRPKEMVGFSTTDETCTGVVIGGRSEVFTGETGGGRVSGSGPCS